MSELDERRTTVKFGMVLADAGYGVNAQFRHALSERGLCWPVNRGNT